MNKKNISSAIPLESEVAPEPPSQITSNPKGLLSFLATLVSSRRLSVNFENIAFAIFQILTLAGMFKFLSYVLSFIAQKILEGSKLSIKSLYISNCKEDSMKMHVNLVIKNSGPIPVTVVFTKPVKLGFVHDSLKSSSRHSRKSNSSLAPEKGRRISKRASKANFLVEGKNYFGQAEMPKLKLYPSVSNHLGLELNVQVEEKDVFASFASQLIDSENMVLQLTGDVSVLAFGILPIHNLKLDKSCSIKGMKGLKELQINEVVVSDGTDEYLLLKIDCNMVNPADIDVDLGDVNFNMYYKGFLAGTVTIPELKMGSGNNRVSALGFFQPDLRSESATKACYNLLDRYVGGNDCDITIKGTHEKCNAISYWSTALAVVTIPASIRGTQENIIVKASLVLSPIQLISKVMGSNAPTVLSLFNPFDAPISIYEMQAKATMRGTEIGELIDRRYSDPIVMPPHQVTTSPQMDLSLEVGRAALASLFNSVASQELNFDCTAKIVARVGKYPVTLNYSQEKVSLVLGS